MTKEQLRFTMGENIRNMRIDRGISIDELASMLELTPSFLGSIERGQRGTTPATLLKLSDIFGLPIDSFFYHSQGEPLSESNSLRQKIFNLSTNLTKDELDYMILVIKGLYKMNHSKIVDDNGEFLEDIV